MPANIESLLAGRHRTPLEPNEIRRAYNTFMGLDSRAPVRFEEGARTRFRVTINENSDEVPEIVFGSDIYPGQGTADANSALGCTAAAAHELTHWQRWVDKRELDQPELREIDEALTSLEAIQRFNAKLSEHDVRQLVADAIQRLLLFVQGLSVVK
jgi:hypothetical protein